MKIISKSRSYFRRNGSTVAVAIIVFCIGSILMLQTVAINRSNALSTQIAAAAKQRTKQIDEINRHMDCIVRFFSQNERSNKAIADINACRISDIPVTDVQPSVPTPQQSSSASGSNTPTLSPSPEKKTDTNTPEVTPILGVPLIDSILHGLGL